jgi:polyhydroxyalkanoate synthesis regulator phasin
MTIEGSDVHALVARVEALERRFGIDEGTLGYQAAPEKLTLHDRQGRVRAWFGLLDDGSPGLTLSDGEGRARTALSVARDGSAALGFYDADGKVGVRMGIGDEGPRLVFYDEEGKVVILPLPHAAHDAELGEVRISIRDVRVGGARLVRLIRRRVEGWVSGGWPQSFSELLADARRVPEEIRHRAGRAMRNMDTQDLAALERQAVRLLEAIVERVDAAWREEVAGLRGRLAALEQRLDALITERAA